MPTFFLTAAEHSGDALGEALIHALRKKFPNAQFLGVGGQRMAQAGCQLLANPVNRSAMFLRALIFESTYWLKILKQIKQSFKTTPPDVVIPIDSSAINLRIAALAKTHNLPVCYYVAPQIWASRPWRIKKIQQHVDTLCCILPFEEPYFRTRNVNAVYVGHPMFDIPLAPGSAGGSIDANASPKIALFPGSRRAEIDAHMQPMLEILSEIKGRYPAATFTAVAPSEERAWQIRRHLRHANIPVEIRVAEEIRAATVRERPGDNAGEATADAIIRWSDLVLAKSGTVTLQIARQHKPMVVLFSVAWWKWHLFAKFFITTQFIALVNILANRQLVPEFIPFYGSPLPVARKCIELLNNPSLRQDISNQLAELVKPLHPREGILAADRVATEVTKLMKCNAGVPPAVPRAGGGACLQPEEDTPESVN